MSEALELAPGFVMTPIADSPARTAPPDETGRTFGELSPREQLDLLARLSDRSSYWRDVLTEALAESDGVPTLVSLALDPDASPVRVVNFLRKLLSEYALRVADVRGDELTELAE
jgi:hypothetical protein